MYDVLLFLIKLRVRQCDNPITVITKIILEFSNYLK